MAVDKTTGSFPINVYSGLITEKHRKSMGDAIWVYLWILDKQTMTDGTVLGGKPIKISEIELGWSVKQTRRHLETLEEGEYIQVKRAPYGLIIRVTKPKKFKHERVDKSVHSETKESGQKCPVSGTDMSTLRDKNVHSNKDSTVDSTVDSTGANPAGCPRCLKPCLATSGVNYVVQKIHDQHSERFGECPTIAEGKVQGLLSKLLRTHSETAILGNHRKYINLADNWYQSHGYDIPTFCSQYDGIRMRKDKANSTMDVMKQLIEEYEREEQGG